MDQFIEELNKLGWINKDAIILGAAFLFYEIIAITWRFSEMLANRRDMYDAKEDWYRAKTRRIERIEKEIEAEKE